MDNERTETYRGHKIEASASEDRPGCWHWSYSIDGRWYPPSKIMPSDPKTALRQAVAAAKSRIEEMERH